MSSLLTTVECRALVKTALSDSELQAVIDRAEAMITARIGAAQDDGNTVTCTETLRGGGEHLFTKAAFSTVVSIVEDGATLSSGDYEEFGESGLISLMPEGKWGAVCVVVYKPLDQREARIQAAIDLVRLLIERTAMTSENVAGEYSFTAPNWEVEKNKILKSLILGAV